MIEWYVNFTGNMFTYEEAEAMFLFIILGAITFLFCYFGNKYINKLEAKEKAEREAILEAKAKVFAYTFDNLTEQEKKEMEDWLTEDIIKYVMAKAEGKGEIK